MNCFHKSPVSNCFKKGHHKFKRKFLDVPVPIPENDLQINKNIMNKTFHFRQEENMQEKCAAENVDEIGAQVETSPIKSWNNL